MALRFVDSFSHYTDVASKWTVFTSGGTVSIVGSGGRLSGDCLRFGATGGSNGATTTRILDAQQTWIVGAAIKTPSSFNAGITGSNSQIIIAVMDSATTQVDVRLDFGLQKFLITRNGTLLGTGTLILTTSTWYYVELKVKVASAPNGTYELRINGSASADISGTGNTQATGNATADRIRLGCIAAAPSANLQIDCCDLYVCDTSGATNNDFLGDCRAECRFPNGNGNSSGFTGSDGNSTDNYLLVDDSPPNDDTDYVEANPSTTKDTYAFQDLVSTSGTVHGVQIGLRARKTDAGLKTIQSVARLSTTETNSADETLSTSYQYFFDVRETKPGGGAWSITDVNNAEFGEYVSA